MKQLVLVISLAASTGAAATLPGRYIVQLRGAPAAVDASGHRYRSSSAAFQSRVSALRAAHASSRAWIQQNGGQVTGEATNIINAIFVRIPDANRAALESIPGVLRVYPVHVRQPLLDHALTLEKVPDAWAQIGGMQNAGAGIKIGIIDTGIDVTHPGFNDPSLTIPAGFPLANQDSDLAYTNNKIIVARAYTDGPANPPSDTMGHGTGVAMTAAGVTTTGPFGIITGVAPKAFLGNYKVFPDSGDGASDDLIISAIDDAVADGMDVINLSLGSVPAPRPEDDILVQAVENAVSAGVIATVAGGNFGSDPATIPSPAIAPDAISVGSTSNDRNFAGTVQAAGNTLVAIPGNGPNSSSPITAPLTDVSQFDGGGLACTPLPAGSLNGSVALILRGVCTFEQKINNAQQAGAAAALIYTDGARPDAIPMSVGAATLPAAMLGYADGSSLKQQLSNSALTVSIDFTLHPYSIDPGRLSSFSSVGPNTDGNIKPDILAVGDIISTAQPVSMNGGFVVESGTSFSSPMLAGAAALLKAARPGLTAQQYRSLLINSASKFLTSSGAVLSVEQTGAGLLNMSSAINDTVAASPVSLSFGTGGSTVDQTSTLTLTNVGSGTDTFSIVATAAGLPGVTPTITPSSVQIDPGQSATVSVEFAASGLDPGAYSGVLQVQPARGPVTALVPYWYGIPSDVPAYLTVLYAPSSGSRGSRQTIYYRISDKAGLPVFMDATVKPTMGGGSFVRLQNIDSFYPGVYAATVRLGITAGENDFQISAGDLAVTVVIPVN